MNANKLNSKQVLNVAMCIFLYYSKMMHAGDDSYISCGHLAVKMIYELWIMPCEDIRWFSLCLFDSLKSHCTKIWIFAMMLFISLWISWVKSPDNFLRMTGPQKVFLQTWFWGLQVGSQYKKKYGWRDVLGQKTVLKGKFAHKISWVLHISPPNVRRKLKFLL